MVGTDDDDGDPFEDDSSSETSLDPFRRMTAMIKENDPQMTYFFADGEYIISNAQYVSNEEWEELGRDISRNSHCVRIRLYEDALNDETMSSLFRGLTRSDTMEVLDLDDNDLSAVGVRSMVPFLQNANNLMSLDLGYNNLQSDGFNKLFRALQNSPIFWLWCYCCGIESIDIDSEYIPRDLVLLNLRDNTINANGCRELAKLLQGRDATLKSLELSGNEIDDHGVEVLVDALQNNTSLQILNLKRNDDISKHGNIMLLKLVNDISSIEATLQSNLTLCSNFTTDVDESLDANEEILRHIDVATRINKRYIHENPEAAGREKVIETQLHSVKRAILQSLQGVDHSVYGEIMPLHLPEVLSLIGRHHGQGELFLALLSTIMGLLSTVNMKKCVQQEKAHHEAIIAKHAAIVAELDVKLKSMGESSEVNEINNELEPRSNKRRRYWGWRLWGGA